jgi:opacity protein-like surface antigen
MLFSKRSPGLRLICWMPALAVCLLAGSALGQVVPSATRASHALWVGAEYSNIHAGFPYQSNQRLWGIGGFADYHLSPHIAVEVDARFLRFNSFYGETEDNYLTGPRYLARYVGKFQPYAQCLAGFGAIQYPFQIGSGRYFALAPGGGASYRISHRLALRGEYEYQLWLNSPNIVGEPAHMITPYGFHVGVAYKVFR